MIKQVLLCLIVCFEGILAGTQDHYSRRQVNNCRYGQPLAGIHCGRGGTRCPAFYYCEISPVDAYADCCPDYCGNNREPLLDRNRKPVYCGRGGIRCPRSYNCHIAPTDAWAVCCSK